MPLDDLVAIAVEYYGYFYYDFLFDAKGLADSGFVTPSSDPYTRDDFKADIKFALVQVFGASAVETGKIAFRVRKGKTTLPADVVPCWEYRRYDRVVNGYPDYNEGSRVYPSDGGYKNNFPKMQQENGTAKNKRTSLRYKRMVRALKKLQTKLVADGLLDEELPSYLIECLVYNVPDRGFAHERYRDDMRAVLMAIFNATLVGGDSADWEEVHGLNYLFGSSKQWTGEEVHQLADIAWDTIGYG